MLPPNLQGLATRWMAFLPGQDSRPLDYTTLPGRTSSRSASPDAAGQSLCSLFPPGFPAVPHYLNHTSVVTNPSQNRACAIYAHGSSHSQFAEIPNILTLIRGSGKGRRFSISQNFCQLRQPRLPRRFSHLNSSFLTSFPYLLIPRRLSVTP